MWRERAFSLVLRVPLYVPSSLINYYNATPGVFAELFFDNSKGNHLLQIERNVNQIGTNIRPEAGLVRGNRGDTKFCTKHNLASVHRAPSQDLQPSAQPGRSEQGLE